MKARFFTLARSATLGAGLMIAGSLATVSASAANLYNAGNWAALASDRPATKVGDSITVIIDESSAASDSASSAARKSSHFGGQAAATPSFNVAGSLDLGSGFDGSGQTQHTHKMVAQLSVVVDRVLPNGDLHVTGSQALKVNRERTNIHLSGRIRPADIDSDNTVLSTKLADAVIDYDGSGFIDRNVRPGLFNRIISWLGLP